MISRKIMGGMLRELGQFCSNYNVGNAFRLAFLIMGVLLERRFLLRKGMIMAGGFCTILGLVFSCIAMGTNFWIVAQCCEIREIDQHLKLVTVSSKFDRFQFQQPIQLVCFPVLRAHLMPLYQSIMGFFGVKKYATSSANCLLTLQVYMALC